MSDEPARKSRLKGTMAPDDSAGSSRSAPPSDTSEPSTPGSSPIWDSWVRPFIDSVRASTTDREARPQTPPAGSGSDRGKGYTFLQERNGRPVTFEPGKPIRYAIRQRFAPPNGVDLVNEALARITAAAGFRFEYAGVADDTAPQQETLLARLNQPVWIGWAAKGESDLLPERAVGIGCQTYALDGSGNSWVASGAVMISHDHGLAPRFGRGPNAGNALLHEVGHLLGLGHTEDQKQIMFPSLSIFTPDGYGEGDLAGLRALAGSSGARRVGKLIVNGLRIEAAQGDRPRSA